MVIVREPLSHPTQLQIQHTPHLITLRILLNGLVLTIFTGADGYAANDVSAQWRLPWYGTAGGDPSQEGRVFVKPGVVCNTLCDDWYLGKDGCKAVQEKPDCL
jgi:hypothetical protein